MRSGAWIVALLLAGCGSGDDGGADADSDSDTDSDSDADSDVDLPAWDRGLPGTDRLGEVRGRVVARGIIHCHSVYSHDACDGDNLLDGEPNEECLSHLRDAVCATRQDFVMMSEHDDEMADFPFEDMFLMRGDDEPVMAGGVQVASRIRCDEGDGTLVFPGAENHIMPLMLTDHPGGDVETRHDVYNTSDPAVAQEFRDQGGLVFVPHTEQWSAEELRAFGPDGLEIYNLHSNLDPRIRSDWLGLDAFGAMTAAVTYALDDREPLADLVLLAMFEESPTDLDRWDALLEDGPMPGVLASDSHENAIPGALSDGERGDSYRRVFRWFGNYLLVDARDPAGIRDALRAGRLYGAFHVLGVPEGFDFRAESSGGTLEMGETGAWEAGTTIRLSMPTVMDLDPSLPPPEVRATILRVREGVRVTVAEGDSDLEVDLTEPGVYRAEVRMVPNHLEPYLEGYDPSVIRELVWVYSGAIRLR